MENMTEKVIPRGYFMTITFLIAASIFAVYAVKLKTTKAAVPVKVRRK
jgi:hypothetical protein